jgi:hypothetical protein
VLGLEWAAHSSLALGAEYDTRQESRAATSTWKCRIGLIQRHAWHFSPVNAVALCGASAASAPVPPFEGVRLDVSTRF